MEKDIYGYRISDGIVFCCSPPHLFNTLTGKSVRLRSTMSILLTYLINNAYMNKVSDETIMTDVFEQRGLKCSRQRLWQAIHSLEALLIKVGLSKKLVSRVDGNGYAILNLSIAVLYFYIDDEVN
jgi:DNA-binding winged helix-turn-helix (wHTH) protein